MSSTGWGYKPSKFKVGDKVKIMGGKDTFHSHNIGDIGEVTETNSRGTPKVLVSSHLQWVEPKDLRKVGRKKVGTVRRKCNIKFD